MTWRCPECGRSFGRAGQWHSCHPVTPLADWLAQRPEAVREVITSVTAYLRTLGADVVIETTDAAVMVKRARTYAELKPRKGHVELGFIVSRLIEDPRITRTQALTPHRTVHVVELHDPGDLDAQLRAWLGEAHINSPVTP